MSQIWFTSDTHFNHNKPFIWESRGFKSVDEMNEEIIERWNSVVKDNDIVYHLGDVMLGDLEDGLKCLNRLNGHIYIAMGNHCTDNRAYAYRRCDNVWNVEMGYRIKAGKKTLILSHYPTIVTNFEEERPMVINLCGHCHTKDKFKDIQYGCYHVELDAHNCYPVALEEVLADIRQKKEELNNEEKR